MDPILGCASCPAPTTVPTDHGSDKKKGKRRGDKDDKRTVKGKQAPEFTPIPIVFNLCSITDSGGMTRQFVEEYSGYSGFHIRTIPGERWRNPQFISAANQWLVVIDRFADYDMVRVTDKYAGAGAGGFNEDGFPLPGVDWGNLGDLDSIALPNGYRATGLVLVERGTALVNLSNGTGDTFLYKWQIGIADQNVNGLIELGSWGDMVGAPTGLFSRPGEQMYFALSIVQRDESSAIMLYDWLREKPVAFQGLPDGWTPIAVGEANNVVSVLMSSEGSTYIVRFPFNQQTAIMNGGVRGDQLPTPQDYTITKTFQPFDPGFVIVDLNLYTEYTTEANRKRAKINGYPSPSGTEETELAEGGRDFSGSAQDRNDSRSQVFQTYSSSYYGQTLTLRGNIIANPTTSTILGLSDSFGAVCETLRTDSGGEIDPESPIFRVVEGKTHSYLSDGGFVYGCSLPDASSTGVTSGYIPGSIAIDVGYERGRLKELPDLKVGLVDAKTGLYIWQPVKPFKHESGNPLKIYAGEYAGLSVPSGSTIKSSQCTAPIDAIAQKIDGIVRPGHTSPGQDPEPEQFTVDTTDLDAPWNYFTRRAVLGNTPSLSPTVKSFSIREPDGIAFLPEHRDAVGICATTHRSNIYWPRVSSNVDDPIFQQSVRSGFFVPSYQKERTTTHTILREQIDELQAQNTALQSAIDSGTLTPAQISTNQAQIAANNSQVASIQDQIATTDDETTYRTLPSVLAVRYPRLEGTTPQLLTDPDVSGDFDQSSAVEIPEAQPTDPPLVPWSVIPVEGTSQQGVLGPIRRGAVMDTNIRSWIGVDVALDRLGVITNGVANYLNPTYWQNGLGARVGGNDYDVDNGAGTLNGLCHAAAFSYEAGYRAWDGAIGVWEIDVLANGVPIDSIATRLFSVDDISALAPFEAQDVLAATLLATGGVSPFLGYRKGKVYYSSEVINSVTIRARLINYAYGVYRVGYRTVHRIDSAGYYTDSWCPGPDPGVFASVNCESCCGNVSCTSFIFFGNKLFASDPIYPRTRQILWEGEATYTVSDDPYQDELNVGMGRVIDAYFDFNLNATMSSYSVNISKNQ